ncbi:MAG: hypothetical protein DLM65_12930 [Candidatus Aeolococcus gillhamiae]|uniref:SAM-dependent methyltransferase n=1 Tax=Candidatus Aeolococcus gillhamiae TaxID=3127015 RepID=A0A2W5YZK5_9BACT|nr:MAG: hypothetical protein DLM65_12930 [Candidatus Dormibacter sp. RRmetagenome_bin12]
MYRPLAEQLAGLAAPGQGESVLELSAGDGELTARLQAAVGGGGSVEVIERPGTTVPRQGAFDLVVSLLAVETQAELDVMQPHLEVVAGRAFIGIGAGGLTYDNALQAAWRRLTGADLGALASSAPVAAPRGWRQRRLSDVARFDGIDQLLIALLDERGIDVAPRRAALRERLAREVAPFTAADGTMRIPVHVTLVEHGAADSVNEGRP